MLNIIEKKIAMIYQQRRLESEDKAPSHREKILALHPNLREIEDELILESANTAKLIIADGKPRNITPRREELIKIRKEYLLTNNIPIDYDRPNYVCSLCNDTGLDRKCNCYMELLVPFLFEYSNFYDISKYSFEKFKIDIFSIQSERNENKTNKSPREQIEAIRDFTKGFVKDFDSQNTKSLFFIGSPGTGKTFLAGCVADYLIRSGKTVLYLSSPDMFERISEYRTATGAFSLDNERVEKASFEYNSIINCDLLIIDDLGTETYNSTRQPELLTIINKRAATGKKMIITTNLDMKSLMNFYDERLLSRIYGNFSIMKFFGEDLRIKAKINSQN